MVLLPLQVIPKKGEDPHHDMREKALARIGTRYAPFTECYAGT